MALRSSTCSKCKMLFQKDHICVDLSYRVPGEARVQNGEYKPVLRKVHRAPEARGDFHSFSRDFARPREHGPDVNPAANPFRQKRSW